MDNLQNILQPLAVSIGLITGTGSFLGLIDANKKLNGITIEKKEKHLRSGLIALGGVVMSLLVLSFWEQITIINVITYTIMLQTVYWVVFDLSINLFSGEKWDYISDNQQDHNDVLSDRAFHWLKDDYSGKVQMVVKMIILITCLIIIL